MENRYSLSVDREESTSFAALSGDFNPLHLDPVYSRRLQYGNTVVHGIHLALKAMNTALEGFDPADELSLLSLDVKFSNPVRTGEETTCVSSFNPTSGALKITLSTQAGKSMTLRASLKAAGPIPPPAPKILAHHYTPESPRDLDATGLKENSEEIELVLDELLYRDMFPALFERFPRHQLAQTLSTTRLVGMRLPGLHSIFSGLRMQWNDQQESNQSEGSIRFTLKSFDKRFSLCRIDLSAAGLCGRIDAFLRPRPSKQRSLIDIASIISSDEFNDQYALIVGGSRGIGEASAKILAAGGAHTIITYYRGVDDAKRVQQEIETYGGSCDIVQLDVTGDEGNIEEALSEQLSGITHVYFFATPHIDTNFTKRWNNSLYLRYTRYYVEGLGKLIDVLTSSPSAREKRTLGLFYPSTIFIDDPEPGLNEYTVAKSSGETLCKLMAVERSALYFHCPRLPRMSTDQTISLAPLPTSDPVNVMVQELRAFSRRAIRS